MHCSKCGNSIDNVPEHLRDLATWICQKCTNTAPKPGPIIDPAEDEPIRKRTGPKKAA